MNEREKNRQKKKNQRQTKQEAAVESFIFVINILWQNEKEKESAIK